MIDYNQLNGPQRKILREALTGVFVGSSRLDMFLQERDFGSLDDLVEPGRFPFRVFKLIGELRRLGRLDDLVAAVKLEIDFAESPDLGELDDRLALADKEAEEQRVVVDSGLEKMVRDAGFSDLNLWAGRLLAAGRRVCRISYPLSAGLMRGTGFLVANDRVLTNYHVIEQLESGKSERGAVKLAFGYAETAEGLEAGEVHGLAENWLLASSRYSKADLKPDAGLPAEDELDFALVALDGPAGSVEGASGPRGWYELGEAAAPSREDDIVFVLQHPAGEPLKQSIGVLQPSVSPVRLRYDADTKPGSSGALVLDQQLAPVALHHAGDPDSEIRAQFNQGIPLSRIHTALESIG